MCVVYFKYKNVVVIYAAVSKEHFSGNNYNQMKAVIWSHIISDWSSSLVQ